MIENTIENQTQFMQEQVLWEQPEPELSDHQESPDMVKHEKKNPLLIILCVILGLFVVLLLLAVVMKSGKNPGQLFLMPSPTPTTKQTIDSELQKSLDRLHKDIKQADPTVNELPFPPVNFVLYIQPKVE